MEEKIIRKYLIHKKLCNYTNTIQITIQIDCFAVLYSDVFMPFSPFSLFV